MGKLINILTISLFFSLSAKADMIRVAIIDTGLNNFNEFRICKNSAKDFTGYGMQDMNGHGTNVATMIKKYAKDTNYCIIPIKYFHTELLPGDVSHSNNAFIYAMKMNADIINFSAGGMSPNLEEKRIINEILKRKIVLITAAGNESMNLDKNCNYFPACYYDKIIVVGNKYEESKKSSNYGKIVDLWEDGHGCVKDVCLEGTSQAAGIATGKLLNYVNTRKPSSQTEDAIKNASKAAFKQSGIENRVNNELKMN